MTKKQRYTSINTTPRQRRLTLQREHSLLSAQHRNSTIIGAGILVAGTIIIFYLIGGFNH